MNERTKQDRGGATGMTPIDAPDAFRRNWLGVALLGLVLVLGGVFAIAMPVIAGVAATLVIGVALLVGGVLQVIHAVRSSGWRARAWHVFSGVVYVVGGLLLTLEPLAGVVALSLLIVAILIVDGGARTMIGLRMRPERGWGWLVASGLFSVVLGLLVAILGLPEASLVLLGAVVGVSLAFEGFAFIYLAFAARPRSDRTVTPDADERAA